MLVRIGEIWKTNSKSRQKSGRVYWICTVLEKQLTYDLLIFSCDPARTGPKVL